MFSHFTFTRKTMQRNALRQNSKIHEQFFKIFILKIFLYLKPTPDQSTTFLIETLLTVLLLLLILIFFWSEKME